jgi:hypothetical protein
MREVLRSEVVGGLRHGEGFPRHRFDDVELPQAHEDLQEPRPRPVDEQRVADCLLQAQALFHVAPRVCIPGKEAAPPQFNQRAGDLTCFAARSPQRHGLFDGGARVPKIAAPGGNLTLRRERPRARIVVARSAGKGVGETLPALAEVRMQMPEPSERAGELECAVRIADSKIIEGRAQVVVLLLQEVETFLFVVPPPRMNPFGERREVSGMSRTDGIRVGARVELFAGELPDGLEHAEPFAFAADDVLIHQRGDRGDLGVAHRFRSLQREPAGEHREPREQCPLAFLQQFVAPLERAAKGSLALRQVACTPGQELQPLAQALQDRIRREERYACSRELERQRQSVESHAQFADRRRILRRKDKSGFNGLRPQDEEPDRCGRADGGNVAVAPKVGKRQRRHGENPFAGDVQRLAARDDQLRFGRLREDLRKRRRAADDLLEVVEHEQDLLRREICGQRLSRGFAHAERPGNGRQQELGLANRLQHDHIDAIREVRQEVGRSLQRKASLAGASRSRQHDEAHVGPADERGNGRQLAFAADRRRRVAREVRRALLRGTQRRKLPRQIGAQQLVDPLGLDEILEPVCAEVDARHVRLILEEIVRRLREKNLFAMAGRTDPRRAMDADADVIVAGQVRLARVNPHPDANALSGSPCMGRESALRVGSGAHGVDGTSEGDEQRIAFGAELMARMVREGAAQEAAMLLQGTLVASCADRLEERGRALDVAEEEGDRTRRTHRSPPGVS